MNESEYRQKAARYLNILCSVKPNRRTGSPGNQDATNFFAGIVNDLGYNVDTTAFSCLDYTSGESSLVSGDNPFDIYISPYSLGCDITVELIRVSSVEELENC